EQTIRGPLLGLAEPDAERERLGRGYAVHFVAEEGALQLVEQQDEAVRQQYLREMIACVQPRDGELLDDQTDDHHDRHADEHREKKRAGPTREPVREVRAQHVERSVSEVHHPEDAEHDRQPAGDEEEQKTVLDSVEELQREQRQGHFAIAQPAAGSCASFIATPSTISWPPFTWRR